MATIAELIESVEKRLNELEADTDVTPQKEAEFDALCTELHRLKQRQQSN